MILWHQVVKQSRMQAKYLHLAKQGAWPTLYQKLKESNKSQVNVSTSNQILQMITQNIRRYIEQPDLITKLVLIIVEKFDGDLHQGKEALFRAAVHRNIPPLIRICIQNNAQLDVKDNEVILMAINQEQRSLLKHLLTSGQVNVNARDNLPLRLAIKLNDQAIITELILAGANEGPLVDQYTLTDTDRKGFADFFITFCASVNAANDQNQLSLIIGSLLQARIFATSEDTEFLRNASAKGLCNWMKVTLFSHQSACASAIDILTGQPIARIPLVYLWSTIHPVSGERMCFDLFNFYHHIQKSKQSRLPGVPIPVNEQVGLTSIEFFTESQIRDAEKVYASRMKLFWQLRNHLVTS